MIGQNLENGSRDLDHTN